MTKGPRADSVYVYQVFLPLGQKKFLLLRILVFYMDPKIPKHQKCFFYQFYCLYFQNREKLVEDIGVEPMTS